MDRIRTRLSNNFNKMGVRTPNPFSEKMTFEGVFFIIKLRGNSKSKIK
ncbi:hypothetical protein IMPR6_360006 [Imperialibacter sp. EC-SDR9]|nr:hypothetical protein IMPR6_360006 [Imperialibacter sp. EC-SDR9]